MRRNYTVRLDLATLEALAHLAESLQLPVSAVARAAIEHLVDNPEILAGAVLPIDDLRTPPQQDTWLQDAERLTSPEALRRLLANQPHL